MPPAQGAQTSPSWGAQAAGAGSGGGAGWDLLVPLGAMGSTLCPPPYPPIPCNVTHFCPSQLAMSRLPPHPASSPPMHPRGDGHQGQLRPHPGQPPPPGCPVGIGAPWHPPAPQVSALCPPPPPPNSQSRLGPPWMRPPRSHPSRYPIPGGCAPPWGPTGPWRGQWQRPRGDGSPHTPPGCCRFCPEGFPPHGTGSPRGHQFQHPLGCGHPCVRGRRVKEDPGMLLGVHVSPSLQDDAGTQHPTSSPSFPTVDEAAEGLDSASAGILWHSRLLPLGSLSGDARSRAVALVQQLRQKPPDTPH